MILEKYFFCLIEINDFVYENYLPNSNNYMLIKLEVLSYKLWMVVQAREMIIIVLYKTLLIQIFNDTQMTITLKWR